MFALRMPYNTHTGLAETITMQSGVIALVPIHQTWKGVTWACLWLRRNQHCGQSLPELSLAMRPLTSPYILFLRYFMHSIQNDSNDTHHDNKA